MSADEAVEHALSAIWQHAETLCGARKHENAAILARDDHKDALINALVGNVNPLTSKPHSATSAAAEAEKDEGYRALNDARHAAAAACTMAEAFYEVAKLRAAYLVRRAEVLV